MVKKKRPPPADAAELRRRAEAKLNKDKQKAAPAIEADSLRLVHELQVHQIELEMQNEELAQARYELEKSLRQYTDLYDFAPVGYFTLARDGTILQVNLVGANLLGVERGALIKRRFGLFVAVESRPAFNAFLENLSSADGKKTCELALLKNGNAMFWARLEAGGFEGGQECRVALVDINERKQAEEKLRQSEERIRYILDNMVEGGQIISHDWRYLYVNDAVAVQGRRKPEELLGHTMQEMYPGIETTELFATLQHCMEDHIHHHMLNEFTYPDGSQGWFELSILPVPEGIFILSNDITARKQSEELLRESEERYRDLVEVSPSAIAVQSEGRLVFVNPAALKLLGAAHSGQLIGKPIWEYIHPDYHQIVQENIRKLAEGQQVPLQERKFIRLDGSSVDVEVFTTRLVYQNRPAVQIIAQDITKRKQTEEALGEKETQIRVLSDNLPNGYVYQVDFGLHGEMRRFNYVSAGVERLHGISAQQAMDDPMTLYRQMLEEDRAGATEVEASAFASMTPFKTEARYRIGDGQIGWMLLHSKPRKLDNNHIVWDGIALDITERKQAEARQTILYETLHAVGAHLNPDAAASAAVEVIGKLGNWASVAISLANLDGQTWTTRAGTGLLVGTFGQPRSMNQGVIGRAYRTGQMQLVSDVSADPDYFAGTDQPVRIRSELAMPIQRDGHVLGILNLESETLNAFSPEDVALAESLAGAMELAFEKARLYASAQQEITERKQAEEALHESQERFRSLSEAAFEGIMIHERGIILDANQVFADLFGFHGPDELIGRNGLEILPLTAESLEKIKSSIRTSLPGTFEIEVVRSDGSTFPAETQGGDMIYKGRKVRVVAMRDITERKQAEDSLRAAHSQLQAQLAEIEKLHIELREQAIRDPLTGLYNRRYLFEALSREVPRAVRAGYPISIILLDIDHFKIINDTFGHDAGDKTLRVLAAQLHALARVEDIVCRYGGDEHLIVMHDTPAPKAVERADQLRKAIVKKSVSHAGKSFKFTCSFGVAVFPVHAPTIEEVISIADRALYQSKEMGRNRVALL